MKNGNSSGASFPPRDPGASWNVPRVSLPGLMGQLTEYDQEWWYYAGTIFDESGRAYSCMFTVSRVTKEWPQIVAGIVGIGWQEGAGETLENHYVSGASFGLGVNDKGDNSSLLVPPVTDETYGFTYKPLLGLVGIGNNIIEDILDIRLNTDGDESAVTMTSGITATRGSEYVLTLKGTGYKTVTSPAGKKLLPSTETSFDLTLNLFDERGMVMENLSGYVGPKADHIDNETSSYECAQPRLKVMSGIMDVGSSGCGAGGQKVSRGMIWLDRQMLKTPGEQAQSAPIKDSDALKALIHVNQPPALPLYVGDWMGFSLNSGLSMVLVNFWDEKPSQWISGTKVGAPPKGGFGNVYYPIWRSQHMGNGGRLMRPKLHKDQLDHEWEYDVNLLNPNDAQNSPHWKSPQTQVVYATAWQIDFSVYIQTEAQLPPRVFVFAVCDACEVVTGTPFFEGAALVYADADMREHIGHVFVEQMGFNA